MQMVEPMPLLTGRTNIWANAGGGIHSYGSNLTISNCVFDDNYAGNGGAIKDIGSPLNVDNTIFSNDTARNHGGAFDGGSTAANFTNCIFYNNRANRTNTTMGGALQLYGCTSGTNLTNCTFFNNKAGQGGAIRAYDSPVTAKNTIFYDNYDDGSKTAAGSDIWDAGAGTRFHMSNCLMQLASGSYTSGNSNNLTTTSNLVYNQDPLFFNSSDPDGADNIWMTKDDGLKLKSTSPAVDVGLNSAISSYSTDIVGTTRTVNTTVNMGAYELLACQQGNTLPTTSGTITATYADLDGSFVCYCDDNSLLLLALDTTGTGAVVPTSGVSLQIGATATTSWNSAGGIITNSSGGAIINRKWDVAPTTQPSSDVTVLYPFTNSEYSAIVTALSSISTTVTNPNQLEMYKLTSSGTFADPHASGATGYILVHGSTATTGNWVYSSHGNGTDHIATYKVVSFSGGGGGGGASGNSLPVEFIQFDVNPSANHSANLNWATASEINNSHFEIERSYDGRAFETVGEVAGNGNSQHQITYRYLDEMISPTENNVFYRLKQVDFDGAFEYSDIRVVRFDALGNHLNLVAYPNPITDDLTLMVGLSQGENYNIQAVDMQGTRVFEENYTFTNGIHRINTAQWASGMYILKVASEQGSEHIKVMKK